MTTDYFQPNPIIVKIISEIEEIILKNEKKFRLPANYLITEILLHLLQYSEKDLYNNGYGLNIKLLREECEYLASIVKNKIDSLPKTFINQVQKPKPDSKITIENDLFFELTSQNKKIPLIFKEVTPQIGFLIQTKLHYMGCPRNDTLFHFGLFREDQKYPFAYVAYSVLDRNYLWNHLPIKPDMDQILVLTRAFNLNSAPYNTMTKLIGSSLQYVKQKIPANNFQAVITCINPNLMFRGTIFKAANFYPFATVPFEPLYHQGLYVTRKTCLTLFNTESRDQLLTKHYLRSNQIPCQPYVWMGRGFSPKVTKIFKDNQSIQKISRYEYRQG